jgi:phasin family protein
MADEAISIPAPKAEAPRAPAATPVAAPTATPAPKADAPQTARARKAADPVKTARPAVKAKRVAKAKPAAHRKPRAKKAVRAAGIVATAAVAAAARKIVTRTIQNEGKAKMKNETSKIADRVQAVFGDVNERAKVAFERNTRIAEELSEFGKGNVEAIVASGKIAAKGLETVGQEVAEYGRKSFEDASAALKSFAEVKSPTDFFRLQSEFARSQFDSFVSEASKLSEAVVKLAGDVAAPLAGRYSVAAEKAKAVAAF